MEVFYMDKGTHSTRKIVVVGMLTALTVVLGISGLGIIEIPGLFRATIMHIPVIIAAILEGPIVGAATGLLFGVWSMVDKIIRPTPTGFVFLNPLVSVLPRVLIGVAAHYVYAGLSKRLPSGVSSITAAAAGSAVNTIGVLGMIYIIFAQRFVETIGRGGEAAALVIFGTAVTNGVPELIASAIISPVIVAAVKRFRGF
jgi:uncharacterized membrane protein